MPRGKNLGNNSTFLHPIERQYLMTAASEASKAPETTPKVDWIMPNQNLLEQVIDARLESHKAAEKPASRSRAASSADKDAKAEDPKS
jgi:hypothetical protein